MGHRRATGRGLVRVACGSGGLSGTSVCAQGLERQERRKHRPPHAGLRLGPQPLREPRSALRPPRGPAIHAPPSPPPRGRPTHCLSPAPPTSAFCRVRPTGGPHPPHWSGKRDAEGAAHVPHPGAPGRPALSLHPVPVWQSTLLQGCGSGSPRHPRLCCRTTGIMVPSRRSSGP